MQNLSKYWRLSGCQHFNVSRATLNSVSSRGGHTVESCSVPVVAVVPVSAVAVVLGWVVVGRVGLRRWSGWRIKADDAAAKGGARSIVIEYDRSADETALASKVLQEIVLRGGR